MTLTVNLKKMVHRKSAELCTINPSGNTSAGSLIVSDKTDLFPTHDMTFYIGGASTIYNYNADQDAWQQLPNAGAAGNFGAGSCADFNPLACPGGAQSITATGGTTTTIVTNLTLVRNLAGCEVRVVGGTNVGYVGTIASNTVGTNATITVAVAAGSAFTSSSVFQLVTGSLWFLNAGAGAIGFAVYDRATNTWTQRSVTNLPTTWGTDGELIVTTGRGSNRGGGFVNGTSSGTNSTTTLNDTGKAWVTNAWTNAQVRIVSGVGLGQIRTISSNTATALTVSSAWTVTPDNTSVYRIEGNDDYIYLLGNNAVTLYRYSISGNTWSTLSPTVARGGAAATGCMAEWVDSVQDTKWNDGTYTAVFSTTWLRQNGRYIYSFRGGAANTLDIYDIAANTWFNSMVYGQYGETFTTGSCSTISDGYIYIQKEATGRIFRFDIANNNLEPWTTQLVPQGTAVVGGKMFVTNYIDGGNRLSFLYSLGNTRSELSRWIIV